MYEQIGKDSTVPHCEQLLSERNGLPVFRTVVTQAWTIPPPLGRIYSMLKHRNHLSSLQVGASEKLRTLQIHIHRLAPTRASTRGHPQRRPTKEEQFIDSLEVGYVWRPEASGLGDLNT